MALIFSKPLLGKLITCFALVFTLAGCNAIHSSDSYNSRETVFDKKVHIEDGIIWDVPKPVSWCEKLHLKNGYINSNGCKIYYAEEGKGIPILLIPGGPGGTHQGFHPHFSKAAQFARVIYFDPRGTGVSEYKRAGGYTVTQEINDIENLRKALKIDKWIVLGWSFGGFIAQE